MDEGLVNQGTIYCIMQVFFFFFVAACRESILDAKKTMKQFLKEVVIKFSFCLTKKEKEKKRQRPKCPLYGMDAP